MMKAYEIRIAEVRNNIWCRTTLYKGSMADANEVLRESKKRNVNCTVNEVEFQSTLSKLEWFAILEADAPGQQDVTLCPMDLIYSRKEIKTFVHKEKS